MVLCLLLSLDGPPSRNWPTSRHSGEYTLVAVARVGKNKEHSLPYSTDCTHGVLLD